MEHRIGAKLSQVSLWLQDLDHSLTQSIEFNIIACDLQDRVHMEILNYLDCVIQVIETIIFSPNIHSKSTIHGVQITPLPTTLKVF